MMEVTLYMIFFTGSEERYEKSKTTTFIIFIFLFRITKYYMNSFIKYGSSEG